MIQDVNHLILIGSLISDAKSSVTKNNQPMTILNIKSSSEWMFEGQKKKKTLRTSVFFFGDKAEVCSQYKKGMKVYITGEVGSHEIKGQDSLTYQTIITGQGCLLMEDSI